MTDSPWADYSAGDDRLADAEAAHDRALHRSPMYQRMRGALETLEPLVRDAYADRRSVQTRDYPGLIGRFEAVVRDGMRDSGDSAAVHATAQRDPRIAYMPDILAPVIARGLTRTALIRARAEGERKR